MLARFGQPVAFAALRGQRVSLWLPSNFGCNELTNIYEQPTQLFITESSWHSGDCASRERDGVWRGSIDKWLGVMHMAWGGSESLRGWLGSPFASHGQDTRPDRPRLHGHPCFFSSKHPRPPVVPRSTLSTTEPAASLAQTIGRGPCRACRMQCTQRKSVGQRRRERKGVKTSLARRAGAARSRTSRPRFKFRMTLPE